MAHNIIRSGAIAVMLAALPMIVSAPAPAAEPQGPVISVVGSEMSSRPVALGVGKAVVIELPRDAKDVLVSDPTIANAVVRSARRAYMIGVKVGQASVFFFDAEGRQIAGFDIAVKRDLNGIREAIRQVLPSADIRVEALGGEGVVLSGIVNSAAESQTAFEIASRLLNIGTNPAVANGEKIVNAITLRGRDQINLRVSVSEMQRDVIKQLGVDLNGRFNVGSAVIDFNNANPFPVQSGPLVEGNRVTGTFRSINATLRAMERAGVIRTLAEPNLTAISGEPATFLAGGEFPIVSGVSCQGVQCTPSIEFKKFGISLSFLPVVLSEGRISLKVTTEVSELSTEGAIVNSGFTIPALRVRRADTTVEIPSGGSLALAGLIQEQTKQQINGFPGLMQVPILGTLFKSRDYNNRQTELMILVTPYVVKPVAQKDVSRADDGFADTADPAAVFLGRLNRIYGIAGRPNPDRTYKGKYGFILD